MKKLINEQFLRMQLLAGLITESQLNEKMEYDDFEQMIKPFLDLAKSKGWIWNSSGDSWFDVSSPAIALYHSTELPTTADEEYKGQKMLASKDVTIGNQVQGFGGNLKNKQGDVIMQSDMNSDQAYFQSKDKAILDAIKASMVNVTDVIQDTKEQSSQLTSAKSFEPVKYYSMILRKKQAPTAESINIEKSVNEALRKYRKLITEDYYDEIKDHVSKKEAGKGNVDHTGNKSKFQENDEVKSKSTKETGKVYDVLITPDKKGTVVVVKWEKDGMKSIGKYGPGFSSIEDIEK